VKDRVSGLPNERAGGELTALSAREREVLELALAGLSARAIAERLTLPEATIRSHLARIYAKLGVGGRPTRTPHWIHSLTLANGRGGEAPRPQAKANCEVATTTQSAVAVRVLLGVLFRRRG